MKLLPRRRWQRLEPTPDKNVVLDHMRGVCTSTCPFCGDRTPMSTLNLTAGKREARILGWERFIRAKQSTLIGRSWDVTHPDDLRDYACHVVNEEEALAAFLDAETDP